MKALFLRTLALTGASLSVLSAAHANIYSCTTTSNGYNFQIDSRDANYARQAVAQQCRNHSSTSNRDCDVNVFCNDGPFYNPMIMCETFSRNYSFSHESRDTGHSRQRAVEKCQSHSSTSNQECSANVTCNNDPLPPAMFSCNTFSNGYDFNHDSRDAALSRQRAIEQCQAHSSTSNQECSVNISCNDGAYYNPIVSCDTFSRGFQFEHQSRDQTLSTNRAIQRCQAHSSTSNQECSVNVSCQYTQPVPPVYPPQPPVYPPYPPVTPPPVVTPPVVTPPVGHCPDPNTVWDASLGRCVSRATPPRPRIYTCTIHGFTASSADEGMARREVLRICGASSGGYVCAGSQVRCN